MRFDTFSDQWITKTIGQYGKFHYGKSAPKWSVSAEGTIPCVRYGELYTRDLAKINSIKSYTTIDFEHLVFSTGKEVLVPRVGEDPMDFYKCAYLPIKNVAIGEMISIYETNQNPLFVTYYFRGKMRKKFAQKVEGGNVSNLYYNYLEPLKVSFPTIAEQQKIAFFLDLLDQRIDTQSKIIEDLESLEKTINNTIFNQLINSQKLYRFSNIYKEAKEGGTPDTSHFEFYNNGEIPFIKIDDITNKYLTRHNSFITELGLNKSSAWIIPTNSILYSNGATIGSVTITTYPVTTKQGILGIVPQQDVLTEYLYYLLKSEYFKKEICKITTQGTMKSVYIKDIDQILIPQIDKSEQNNIIKKLQSITLKIQKEKDILELYKKQKAYLLKNMFI